jgi:Ca2+-binding RTX toxin-like protein
MTAAPAPDTVGLLGSYDLTLGAASLVGIEKLALYSSGNAAAPNGYRITTVDANVAAGKSLMVVAQSLGAGEVFSFNGSAETDGSFNVRGGRGGDTIVAGAGADRLWGGLGADALSGGAGADVFEYRAVAESTGNARDTIADFGAGDLINLVAIDPDGIASNGNGKFSFVGSNAFSGKAGELRLVGEGATWLVEADTDGDREADFAILVQTVGGHALTSSDFLF